MDGMYVSDLKCLVKNAITLADQANHLCGQLDRCDEFDEEQRAEMYAILQALGREAAMEVTALRDMLGAGDEEVGGV